MFRRHCIAAKVSDFGLRDLRAKGATDEYRAGRPIRELQNLLGHKSVRTTEIYLKELIPETVRPNERPMIAGSPKLGLLIYPSQWALSLQSNVDGSPTRARTWDLRINSPSRLYVISLHHQLLTASAHLRHRSRVQCNAGVRNTMQLHFRIHLKNEPGSIARAF